MDEAAIARHLRARFTNALSIYIFGSRASGEAGAKSDLDLALLVEGRADPLALWQTAGEIEDIANCPVDLVDLRVASTIMQYQVVARGRRLWARDVQAGLFEAFVLSEKLDFDAARAGLIADIQREGCIYG